MRKQAIGLLAALALVAACGTKDAPSGIQGGAQGRIRFVNLITDPARVPVNATLETLPFGVALAYGGATPATLPAPATAFYSPVLTGARTLLVRRTADTTVTLATVNLTIVASEDRTVYALGGTAGGAVTTFQTVDQNPAAAATETRWRVVNMSLTTGAVDVFVTATGASLTALTPDAANVAFQGTSAYFTKASSAYQIRFVPAGTAAAARNGSVLFTIAAPAAAYSGGAGRTILAADNAAGAGTGRGFVLGDR